MLEWDDPGPFTELEGEVERAALGLCTSHLLTMETLPVLIAVLPEA